MVARATKRNWVNLVVGLLVGTAAQPLALLAGPGSGELMLAQYNTSRSPRAHEALTNAIEAMRRNDVEAAARYLQEAQKRQNDLTPDEQRELSRLLASNARALQARRLAGEQLNAAENAVRQGRGAEAAALLKKVSANESYLRVADKQRLQQLSRQLHIPLARGSAVSADADAIAGAHDKLQQARAELAEANLEAAEAIAREVEQLGISFGPREDSPRRVMEDIEKARKDAKTLLLAARAALKRNEFDRAEQYARAADKMSLLLTFPVWGDTPAKALQAIRAARAAAHQTTPVTPMEIRRQAQPSRADKARELVQQGRQSLAFGDLAQARKYAEQAAACNAELRWDEDNPARLLADIARLDPNHKTAPAASADSRRPFAETVRNKEEALALLQEGRKMLAKGDVDGAEKAAARLQAAKHIRWSLFFDDTPDKFRAEVDRARNQRKKERAAQLLVEGRNLFEKKDYEGAKKLALQAQMLHGPYSALWDLGDRPSKLMADIETAQAKQRRLKMPEPPLVPKDAATQTAGTAAARNTVPGMNPTKPMGAGASGSASANPFPTATAQNTAKARQLLREARMALRAGDAAKARLLADQARAMRVVLNPGEETPESIYRDLARSQSSSVAGAAGVGIPLPNGRGSDSSVSGGTSTQPLANARGSEMPANMRGSDAARARQLLVEAHMLQRQNRLLEARDKIAAAQQIGATFRPDEETPEQALQQMSFLARQRIDSLITRAGDAVRFGTQAPLLRCQQAEKDLAEARRFAFAFQLDMQPIERTQAMVHQLRNGGSVALKAPMPSQPMGAPGSQSAQLLDQARLELRKGQTATARRLAEEACQCGGRDEAMAVLRSIDSEEFAQKRLRANHAFDAVIVAFNKRDYHQAGLLLAAIDTKLLDERRAVRLREIVNTPEMQPVGRGQLVLASGQQPTPQAPGMQPIPQSPSFGDPGRARATDNPEQTLLAHTRAMREVKFQQLRKDGMEVQTKALERFRSGDTDAALDMLQDYINQLSEEQLDPGQLTLLRRPIESRLSALKLMKAQADFASQSAASKNRHNQMMAQKQNAQRIKEKNVADLMRQYNEQLKIGKYEQAEALALRVKELDPDNSLATAALMVARRQRRQDEYRGIKEGKENMFIDGMNDSENMGDSAAVKNGMALERDPDRLDRIRRRKPLDVLPMPHKTTVERSIESQLSRPVTLNAVGQPLRETLDYLRGIYGINIYVDEPALAEKGISQDQPVSIKLENIALKSALNLLLKLVHLTWVVQDDVLQITTEEHARGKLEQRVYQVADLIVAVENFTPQSGSQVFGMETIGRPNSMAPSPIMGPMTLNGGQPAGTPIGGSMANGGGNFATEAASPGVQVTKQKSTTHEDMLIKLITSTVNPQSWSDMGGPGTLEFYPLTMALVINQTPDIQDQIQELLQALRRLQDQEVAIEVKFISLSEDFFERIGVNFNLNIVNKNATKYEPQLTTGQFANPFYINQFAPGNFLSGLTPAGTLTSDLNIPITQQTFAQAIPPFGGYPGMPGYGGLTLGLAFLSDIQVFLFMEAAQGNVRANVMQAPKLTLFNGQTAFLAVRDFEFFVLGVNVFPQFGQLTYQPATTMVPLGVGLTIQAVITADRRFVRMSLVPTLSNLVNGEVLLFPVVTPIFPLFDGTATGQPVVFTQFVQQPHLTAVNVMTTVAVPDGGTVLMGGLKRLSEGRNEYGPPVLSKIPYLNRLFKNTGYGKSTESLLIMVTPRILIQAEEEEKQTGYRPEPLAGTP